MAPGTKNKNTEQTEIAEKMKSFRSFRLFRYLQISCLCFAFCSTANAQIAKATEDGAKLKLDNRVLLTNEKDGFMAVNQVRYSPDGKRFLVIGCGYECNDNIGFLFNADGTGKRKFTARWDFILQDKVEWSADGKKLYYYRINSSGADSPRNAPPEGWVEVDLATGKKAAAVSRLLKPEIGYSVFRLLRDDWLNVRQSPGTRANVIGKLPHDAKGIRFSGEKQKIGKDIWVKITQNGLTGWVNQNFLYETSKDH